MPTHEDDSPVPQDPSESAIPMTPASSHPPQKPQQLQLQPQQQQQQKQQQQQQQQLKQNDSNRKRKHSYGGAAGNVAQRKDAYSQAYKGFCYRAIPSSGRPGSPHRFFAATYDVYRYGDHQGDSAQLQDGGAKALNGTDIVPMCFCRPHVKTPIDQLPPGDAYASISPYDLDSDHVQNLNDQYQKPILRIHQHANGLCIVTAAVTAIPDDTSIANQSTIDKPLSSSSSMTCQMHIQPAPPMSNGAKRKQQSRMMRSKCATKDDDSNRQSQTANVAASTMMMKGMVRPSDPLCTWHVTAQSQSQSHHANDTSSTTSLSPPPPSPPSNLQAIPAPHPDNNDSNDIKNSNPSRTNNLTFPCGVYGTVLEVNESLTWSRWRHDPMYTGYFAIILPSGPFPPAGHQCNQ